VGIEVIFQGTASNLKIKFLGKETEAKVIVIAIAEVDQEEESLIQETIIKEGRILIHLIAQNLVQEAIIKRGMNHIEKEIIRLIQKKKKEINQQIK
jgi:hypothetical protein